MPSFSKTTWLISLSFFLTVLLGVSVWWYWNRGPQLDQLSQDALKHAEETTVYGQKVRTETVVSDRGIEVLGEYLLDDTNRRFSSNATTNLTLPDGTEHSFNLQAITIGDNMYVRVESQSGALNLTVPASGEWKQFKVASIPAEYREIATPRPPVDNLTLFRSGGEFLTLKEERRDEEFNGEMLAHYVFGLSPKAFTETTGPVSMIAERVGVHGTIEVWIRESDAQIRYIHFSNPPYSSETTITHVGTLPLIESPVEHQ